MADLLAELAARPDKTASATATAATATATIAAPGTGYRLEVFEVRLTANGGTPGAATMTLVDGASTARGKWQVPAAAFGTMGSSWSVPRVFPENTSAVASVPSLGAGLVATIEMDYRIRPM